MSRIVTVAQTGSTNTDLLREAGRGAAEGDWLRAVRQTAGRGRQGRPWQSAAGNLHASTLVAVRQGDPAAPTLALVAGVAVQEVVAPLVAPRAAVLKWPNDLLVDGAKLAGILLERVGDWVVAGFGVNVRQAPAVDAYATAAIGGPATAEMLVEDLAHRFAHWLGRWRSEGLAPIRERWLAIAHPTGTPLRVGRPGEAALVGRFAGLDADGALRLEGADGPVVVRAGDVVLV